MVEEAILNVRNFFTLITNIQLQNLNDGNMEIALPPVFNIFLIVLQNPRSIDKMLEILRNSLITVKCTIFEYPSTRLSTLLSPSTQRGIGVAGCIGLIGFLLRLCHWTTVIVICLLGGYIGSGIHIRQEMSRDEQKKISKVW